MGMVLSCVRNNYSNQAMKCSRCGSTTPNQSCYVCQEDEQPERDVMLEIKDEEIEHEEG